MTPHEEEKSVILSVSLKLDIATEKINQIHGALFGMDGKGGLFDRVELMEKELKTLCSHRDKALGAIAVISLLCGMVGGYVSKLLK